ncbi:Hypp3412 [Branchiostoma lanceolatum]|uniref:Hypp3412 protein n=1 Tax=Branchiostoma lanceolatum TaxID=7740 RepID=A0A8K0A2W3_BRALA|nr:Hypp3412 [Branchiostoma lanceolatum]
MEFHPPPLPTSVKGAVPNMLAFFTTPAFFWRPVGVMQAKIRCPNTNCQAPPGEYLELKGFGSFARQVCGMKNYYTLLTEKLKCPYCEKARQSGAGPQQYLWMANSIKILMQLAPAIRRLFPAIICGKRAIDRGVVTLLGDRINAASMSKVQRILKQGHDEWYVERRGLFQTLLYEAHTAEATPSQKGILSFVKAPGSYTPPLPKEPLPTPTCLRRAHLIAEMERMPVYRASILSTTGEILCIDGTRKILKKIYGDGRDTMQYVTSVLNEWGQFLTTVVVAAESEACYRRMARGLVARFQRANAPAPKIIYADNNCCRESGASFLEKLFSDWVREGMVVRLDVRHWLHRWDAVVIKQSHAKYANFMSAMAGAVLAYNRDDMMLLVQAVRKGNLDLYADRTDEEMIHFLKPHQVKDYVRRVTRGVEETASVVEDIIAEFKGPGGLDIDGIHLFKSLDAVDAHWSIASKHLCCMQDPPGIQLYVAVKEVVLNGVKLNKYRCRRGSNSLEGLHSHLYNAVPSKRCGILPFQVYLISFAVQWNSQMDSLRVAGGKGRQTTCIDAKQIQLLNQQAEFLFGKNHVLEPNFVAPLPYPTLTMEEEQAREVEESGEGDREESAEQSEEESEDEGVDVSSEDSHMDSISRSHVRLTKVEQVEEQDSPALQDVLMRQSHMHLPGMEEVQDLALLLLGLADRSDQYLVSANLRQKIVTATGCLLDHDKTASSFVKKYQSRWGYTLFGRCLGADTPENRAAQKTKFAWRRYTQAAQVTEETRLLYLLIKMLKNRPPASVQSSPSKATTAIKSQYTRIADRVRGDPILSSLSIPLPNINAKSISNFIAKEEKKANYWATVVPRVKGHKRVLSDDPMPEAPTLPTTLPVPARAQVQYGNLDHLAGERRGAKRRLEVKKPAVEGNRPIQPKPATYIPPRVSAAPVLLVVPAQPQAPSMMLPVPGTSCGQVSAGFRPVVPPPVLASKPIKPHRSLKPCAACHIPNCGGQRKRYQPPKAKVAGSSQKIFTYCPTTNKSTTSGFEGVVFESFDQFKKVVDDKIEKEKTS